jgi:hypothetical protein
MTELAAQLVEALFPLESQVGLVHSIREQILADALQASTRPVTLRRLLQALEADPRCRGSVGSGLLTALGRWAVESPDLPAERLARGPSHRGNGHAED